MKNQEETFTPIEFDFISGYLCLDFINTQVNRQGQTLDLLKDFDHLTAWLVQAELFDPAEMQRARQAWGGAGAGKKILRRARTFRQTLRGMVDRIIAGQEIEEKTVAEINHLLKSRAGYLQLVRAEKNFSAAFNRLAESPLQLLAPVAETAADLLCTADLALIKRCDNPACIRYFYDSTKNHSRRWCAMDTCGNRMKVAAYYARKRRAGR